MGYNLTDEDLAGLSPEQLLELSTANYEMSRRINVEMVRRGLATEDSVTNVRLRELPGFKALREEIAAEQT
jgi:hypothetical protein